LHEAFAGARGKGVQLYDIMTERHEITTLLQKEFSTIGPVFGELLARRSAQAIRADAGRGDGSAALACAASGGGAGGLAARPSALTWARYGALGASTPW